MFFLLLFIRLIATSILFVGGNGEYDDGDDDDDVDKKHCGVKIKKWVYYILENVSFFYSNIENKS